MDNEFVTKSLDRRTLRAAGISPRESRPNMLNDLLDQARERSGLSSDYQLAKKLGIPTSQMSDWRNGRMYPGTLYLFGLAELAQRDPAEVIASLEAYRAAKAGNAAKADTWRAVLGRLGNAAGAAGAVIVSAGLVASADNASASGALARVSDAAPLCIMLSRLAGILRRVRKLSQPRTVHFHDTDLAPACR